jgi:hypothetical protein
MEKGEGEQNAPCRCRALRSFVPLSPAPASCPPGPNTVSNETCSRMRPCTSRLHHDITKCTADTRSHRPPRVSRVRFPPPLPPPPPPTPPPPPLPPPPGPIPCSRTASRNVMYRKNFWYMWGASLSVSYCIQGIKVIHASKLLSKSPHLSTYACLRPKIFVFLLSHSNPAIS